MITVKCFLNQDICVDVDLSIVPAFQDMYIVKNIEKLIAQHNKKCRVFGDTEYPNFIDGIFQCAFYKADYDSCNSKWIQHILKNMTSQHYVNIGKKYGSYWVGNYAENAYVYFET